jgi:small neutral amino acid transporter SnatA (MarC family)
MGLIVVVIGVQFVVDGVRPIAIDILRSATSS